MASNCCDTNILVHEYFGARKPKKFLKRRWPRTLRLREQCREEDKLKGLI
jgi:hypothetical protein